MHIRVGKHHCFQWDSSTQRWVVQGVEELCSVGVLGWVEDQPCCSILDELPWLDRNM